MKIVYNSIIFINLSNYIIFLNSITNYSRIINILLIIWTWEIGYY